MKPYALYFVVAAMVVLAAPVIVNAQGTLYFVNTTSDTVVPGACAGGDPNCSLRGAIQAANAHPGEDGIEFALSTSDPGFNGISWTINLTGALPDITDSVGISGPGADKLTVRRDTGGTYRIFAVTTTGAVAFSGVTINNGSEPSDGSGGAGIAKLSAGTVNVTNCTLSANIGGGVLNSNGGIINITNSTLSGNTASQGFGGGIFNTTGGTVNIINSVLSGNTVDGASGGGVFNNSGTVNITNSTLRGNTVGSSGAGVFNSSGATMNIINSTFSGNSAGALGSGGGIANNGGTLVVSNSTITGNSATFGGGIVSNVGMTVKNSIIALNTASDSGPDASGSFTSSGFNLIGKNDGAAASFPAGNPNANNDIVGTNASSVDPKLELDAMGKPLLEDNGGPTPTVALLLGSPAIDKGTSNSSAGALSTDQRGSGFPRISDDPAIPNASGGDGTDVGAFEVQTSPSPTPTPGSLGNISTRLRVLNGDNALFGGMIATGTGGKKVIIRAIGPTLTDLGLPGALQDPTLDLFQGNAAIGSNDDWGSSAQQAEIANSGFAPNKEAESAIIVTLTPGENYTAIVRGKNGETGIGVVEAFDLDQAAASKLGNISTRGFVDVDDNVMIAGLIVAPSNGESLKVLARALGPTLGDFGVQGFLADPTLDLVNASGTVLRSNDSWQSDQGPQIQAANLAPKYGQEAVLIETLAPGQYTTIVRGSGRTTGVGLVEVYNIP